VEYDDDEGRKGKGKDLTGWSMMMMKGERVGVGVCDQSSPGWMMMIMFVVPVSTRLQPGSVECGSNLTVTP
jgi:hypothetical protein